MSPDDIKAEAVHIASLLDSKSWELMRKGIEAEVEGMIGRLASIETNSLADLARQEQLKGKIAMARYILAWPKTFVDLARSISETPEGGQPE